MVEYLSQKCVQSEALIQQQMTIFEEFKKSQEHRVKEGMDRTEEGEGAIKEMELQSFLKSLKQL